jgi:peptide/nickel transport system substrate-binding protein
VRVRGSWVAVLILLAACGRRDPERQLRVLTQFPVASSDPQAVDDSTTLAVLANVHDALVRFDASGRLVPELARSWSNPDERTWRFELRRDVHFHDGRPFAAADAVETLRRVLARSDWIRSTVPLLEQASAPEEHVLELRTREPSTLLLNQLASMLIVPRTGPATPPIGTGPYRAVRWTAAEVELAAFDGHWRGRPRWRRALFWPEPHGRMRADAVMHGRADVAEAPLAADLATLTSHGASGIVRHPSTRVLVLGLAAAPGRPFADARLRAALASSLDRDALVREAHGGLAAPATQLAPPGVFGYDPDIAGAPGPPHPGASPRQARPVTKAATPIRLFFSGERSGTIARLVARDAGAAAIALEPTELPVPELDGLLAAGRADSFVVHITFPNRDSSDFLSWAFHAPTADGRWGAGNFTRYADRRVDALIEAAEREFNPQRRYGLLSDAMRAAMAAQAWIPLTVPESVHAVRRGLLWAHSSTGRVRLEEIAAAP